MNPSKNIFYIPMAIAFLSIASLVSCEPIKSKEVEFKVRGNCDMCKQRIESTALKNTGVLSAKWKQQSGLLMLKIDSTHSDIKLIHESIANAGHSTEWVEASMEADAALPECCRKNFSIH
jgi:Cu(I)/Ag(I) efflux system membrane fusion protein